MQAGFMEMGQLFFNFQTLSALVGRSDPQPISHTNLDLPYWMFYTPLVHKTEANEAVLSLCREVKPLVDEGKGILPKGAPRIYASMRFAVDPGLTRMFEEAGLTVGCMMADYLLPGSLDGMQSTDPCEVMAEGIYRMGSIVRQATGIMTYMRDTCKDWDVDGCVLNYPYSCRITSGMYMVRDVLQRELGLPTLLLEADAYDNRQYSVGQLRTRVEAFAELLRARKAAAVA
jgi:benzoyl-CoA reductase/2-hydroxyglutaryl-CoA dehydratase subunit BcrC/BadD/HgdB